MLFRLASTDHNVARGQVVLGASAPRHRTVHVMCTVQLATGSSASHVQSLAGVGRSRQCSGRLQASQILEVRALAVGNKLSLLLSAVACGDHCRSAAATVAVCRPASMVTTAEFLGTQKPAQQSAISALCRLSGWFISREDRGEGRSCCPGQAAVSCVVSCGDACTSAHHPPAVASRGDHKIMDSETVARAAIHPACECFKPASGPSRLSGPDSTIGLQKKKNSTAKSADITG